ncbi:MAG: cupin domain-containing protein [Chromatiales bacterium]|nr:cupin domain-containing protein [Chromatiales bacterium]
MSKGAWQVFRIEELAEKVAGNEPRFHEFLRVPAMSCAVYRLPAGSRDMQAPHLEDEVYFVVSGRARLRIDDQEHEVRPGMVLFVRATAEHSFFHIEEDLTLVVIFGPAIQKWKPGAH